MEFNCSYYKKNICRSCDLLELDYEKQIETKNNKLKSLYCDLYENFEIQDFISIKQPFESRYKAKFSVSGSTLNPKIGLITNDYKGIELLNCPLHYPGLNVTIKEIKKQIIKHNIKPYNIADKTGELKNIIIQSSKFNGTQIIRFILNSKKYLKTLKIVSDKITKKFKKIKVVSVNIQPIHQAILEGEEEIIITKKQCITEVFENFKILYYPGSFMQVSPEIAEKLYSTVKDVVLKIEPKIMR